MLTKEDKKWVEEKLNPVRDSIDLLRQKMVSNNLDRFDMKGEIEALRASSFRTEKMAQKILTMQDGYAGKVADLDQENKIRLASIK